MVMGMNVFMKASVNRPLGGVRVAMHALRALCSSDSPPVSSSSDKRQHRAV